MIGAQPLAELRRARRNAERGVGGEHRDVRPALVAVLITEGREAAELIAVAVQALAPILEPPLGVGPIFKTIGERKA